MTLLHNFLLDMLIVLQMADCCNCKYDDLYSIVSTKLLLGCFTGLLNIKAKSQISNIKRNQSAKSNALNYTEGDVLTVF